MGAEESVRVRTPDRLVSFYPDNPKKSTGKLTVDFLIPGCPITDIRFLYYLSVY